MNANEDHRHVSVSRVAVVCGLLLLAGCGWLDSPRARLESQWQRENRCLILVPYAVPAEAAARTIRFDRDILLTHRLYLRSADDPADYVYIDGEGTVERAGRPLASLRTGGELVLAEDRVTLYVDGRRLTEPGPGWQIFWEAAEESAPPVGWTLHPLVDASDGFMRHELVSPPCNQVEGELALAQHGGGLARDEAEARSYDFQRAVNPFTVRGGKGAWLLYGEADWAEYLAEARFYFGIPKTGYVVDANTLPSGTDMLVVQGGADGLQVGFGWVGAERRFCLVERRGGDGPWRVLARHEGLRPPLTSWVRLGVSVRDGCRLEGWLDRQPLLAALLDERVAGPARIVLGGELAEFDDVRLVSLPVPPEPPQPLFALSRSFVGKEQKKNADSDQFGQWAQGSDTFARFLENEEGRLAAGIRTRLPLVGPWEYQSRTYDERLGEMPAGRYRFQILRAGMDDSRPTAADILATLAARRDADGWTLDIPGREPRAPAFQLGLRRTPEGALEVRTDGEWEAFAGGIAASVRFAILRDRGDGVLVAPRPEHHRLFCRNLHNEFFEEAPVDWAWTDGAFRMDARWACQDQWNFLACGSTAVPMIVGKRHFSGEQVHEYYITPRPAMPWDAGDGEFRYDDVADRNNKFPILVANEGWYVRRDFNLSFCTDGRNPLSGYAVLFGADDNAETRLVRRGEVVARSADPAFLFPQAAGYGPMHYFWRRFTVWKNGPRIRVWVDERPLFDYTDPEPIDGGHLAIWSVRNGFAITKVSSLADEVAWRPEVLSVPPTVPAATGWEPLAADELRVAGESGGMTTFARTVGTGFGALRFTLPEPLELTGETLLELPLDVPGETALHLHVHTSAGSFLIPVSAPLGGMKSLLTPEFEKGECFRLPTLDEATIRQRHLLAETTVADGRLRCELGRGIARLRPGASGVRILSLTLGNSSNQDYLLAGHGRNRAGSRFSVGRPSFLAEGAKP